MYLLQLEFIVDMGFILRVKAIIDSILDLISLFNVLASTCLAHAAQTSLRIINVFSDASFVSLVNNSCVDSEYVLCNMHVSK